MKRKIHYAWIILIGIILIRGFAGGGLNTAAGLFLNPVSESLGIGIGQLSIYLSISSMVMMVWLPFVGKLTRKVDIKMLALIGAILHAGSFIGFGFMKSVWGWFVWWISSTVYQQYNCNEWLGKWLYYIRIYRISYYPSYHCNRN